MSEEEKGESEEREEILTVQDLVDFVLILTNLLKHELFLSRLLSRSSILHKPWEEFSFSFFANTIFKLIEASKGNRKKVKSGNNKFVLEHVLDEAIVTNCVNHIQDEDEKEQAKQTIRTVFCTLMMMDKGKVADFLREGRKFHCCSKI